MDRESEVEESYDCSDWDIMWFISLIMLALSEARTSLPYQG